jgi:hypothetical protein
MSYSYIKWHIIFLSFININNFFHNLQESYTQPQAHELVFYIMFMQNN